MGKICTCLTSLIKTIGGEFPVHQRNANHNYAYTSLQQFLSQDSSRISALSSVPCTRLWRRQGTEARITRIVWLPYPIPVPMIKISSLTDNKWRIQYKYKVKFTNQNLFYCCSTDVQGSSERDDFVA